MDIILHIQPFLWMATAIFVILTVRNSFKSQKLIFKILRFQSNLMDVVACKLDPISYQQYLVAKHAGPDAKHGDVIRKLHHMQHQSMRQSFVDMLAETEVPENREKLESAIKEIDGIFLLTSTLDENSSQEYAEKVMQDVQASMCRLSELKNK
jgi:hypothetical protein